MSMMMNGGESHYVDGDFTEDGSFLVLNGHSSPPRSPIHVSLDPPPQINQITAQGASLINGFRTVRDSLGPSETVTSEKAEGSITSSTHSATASEFKVPAAPTEAVPAGAMGTSALNGSQMEPDFFSMTNYSVSSSASSTTDNQLEDLRRELEQVVEVNTGLRDLCAKEHDKLKKMMADYEEMKESAAESLNRNVALCEEGRQKVEQLQQENATLRQEIAELNSKIRETSTPQPSAAAGESDFEKLESMESVLAVKEVALKQAEELNEHLNNENQRLKEIIRLNDEVNRQKDEALREKEEMLRQHTEFLSKSDESLARSLTEKEDLEGKAAAFEKRTAQLEEERNGKDQEVGLLSQQVEAANLLIQKLTNEAAEANSTLENCKKALDDQQQQMNVQLITLKSEHENQLESFRYNLQKELAEKKRFEIERQTLMEELNKVNALLITKEEQLEAMNRSWQQPGPASNVVEAPAGSQNSIATLPGQMFGFLKREVMGIGAPSPSIASTQSFEFVGAGSPQSPPVPAPRGGGTDETGVCPICQKTFDSIQRLQRHAANCGIEMMAERSDPFVFP